MWGELRKLRSNAAIRISLYILQRNKFAELRKLRSNAAIRISLLHWEGLYEHYKA